MMGRAWHDLGESLGASPDPVRWSVLELTGEVTVYEEGVEQDLERLVAAYQRTSRSLRYVGEDTLPADEIQQARAVALAQRVEALDVVRSFRLTWMDGQVIQAEMIGHWIAANNVAMRGWTGEWWTLRHDAEIGDAGDWSDDVIWFASPGPVVRQAVPVVSGSPVARLKALADSLASLTPWTAYECASFILTGQPPETNQALGTAYVAEGPLATWGRVILDIDPGSPATAVADLYRRVRSRLNPPRQRRAKRSPAMLLEFVAAHEGEPWPAILAAWNSHHPDLAYSQVTNLQRDHARALRLADRVVDNG